MIASAARKVLVIDDELGPRESVRFLLKDEYEVFCACGVDEGVAMLREHHPDLIIMDIRMPGKSGIDGLREIRAIDTEVSVVMLTGYGALETAQDALRLGATDYLNKPFDTSEMRSAVRRYVERTRMERQRFGMLNELQEINTRLMEDLAGREHMASMAQASAEIAHDMRNPLMIVSGYVELLTSQLENTRSAIGPEYEKTADYLDVIGQNVRRCCDLSHMWQKFGKNKLTEFNPTVVSELLDDVVMGAAPLAAAENVEIRYDVQSGHALIHGSRPQLIRAVHNIIANAIQAVGSGGGHVAVACAVNDDQVDIVVKDNGPGMSREVQERIFEPYFTTKSEGKGTGLGMAITRRIMEEHNGSIQLKSAPGEGTEVRLSLPLLAEVAA